MSVVCVVSKVLMSVKLKLSRMAELTECIVVGLSLREHGKAGESY